MVDCLYSTSVAPPTLLLKLHIYFTSYYCNGTANQATICWKSMVPIAQTAQQPVVLLHSMLSHLEEPRCTVGLFCEGYNAFQVYADLDDKLLQEFPAFLEERGINADMGNYLLALVNDKEEREYRSWLGNVQKFLKK